MDIFMGAIPDIKQMNFYKLSMNKVTLFDSWLSEYLNIREESYIDMKQIPSNLRLNSPETDLIQGIDVIGFYLDESVLSIERQVQNLTFAFSIVGGLMGIVLMIAQFFVGLFQEHLFYSSIMRQVYLYREEPSNSLDLNNNKESQIS